MDSDWRYSEDARRYDFCLVWECDTCGDRREDAPGCNEGGVCLCGGTYRNVGESYDSEPRW